MKPFIALTPLIDQQMDDTPWMLKDYFNAVEAAGGIPIMLSPLKDKDDIEWAAAKFDGIVFTGGQDVAPSVYGREKEVDADLWVSPDRDELEIPLLEFCISSGMPILGICRGLQLINAGLGGTLWQDLPSQRDSQICHSGKELRPEVSLLPGTPLEELIGKKSLTVNTLHHQAIRDLAPGLKPMAVAPDGLVEAFYKPDSDFFWAVQWHPEMIFPESEDNLKIIRAFIEACR